MSMTDEGGYVEEFGDLKGWTTIAGMDAGGGYEWDEFRALRSPEGRLHWAFASGCSCNSFSDVAEPVPAANWRDVLAHAREWAADDSTGDSEDRRAQLEEFRSVLTRLRPRIYI